MLAILHHVPNINPLLTRVTSCASAAVIEWEVRNQPFFHAIEEVMASIQSFGWTVEIMDRGRRPLIMCKKQDLI